jgi:hypothetical protein
MANVESLSSPAIKWLFPEKTNMRKMSIRRKRRETAKDDGQEQLRNFGGTGENQARRRERLQMKAPDFILY